MKTGQVLLSIAFFCLLQVDPAIAQTQASQKPGGTLTIDPAQMQKPWTGDLDGMIERHVIRVLTVNSKTFYFQDKGTLRGTYMRFMIDQYYEKEPMTKLGK